MSIGNPAGIGKGTGFRLRERDRDGIGLGHYQLRANIPYCVSFLQSRFVSVILDGASGPLCQA